MFFLSRNLRRFKSFEKITRQCSGIKDHVISSPVKDVVIPEMLLHDYLLKDLDKWHDKIAVECAETGRKLTYNDVSKKSKSLGGFLQNLGLRKGDIVAFVLPNVPEFFIAFLGSIQAGLAITTINPLYTTGEIERQLLSVEAKLMITITNLYPNVKAAVDKIPNVKIPILVINHMQNEVCPEGGIKFAEACNKDYALKDPNWSSNDVVLLPYSSGTTGLPKGVELTHKSLVSNYFQSLADNFKLNTETKGSNQDVVPVILPMFHLYGLGVIALTMFSQGVKLITLPTFSTKSYIDMLCKYPPSILYLVPPIVLLMLNNPSFKIDKLDSLRVIVSGAAPLGATDIYRFQEKSANKIHLLQLYGMTELSPLSHLQTFSLDNAIKIGGSGVILPNTQCKIVDVNDPDCKGLGPNQTGELLCKGPQVMNGYFKNKEATKNTMHRKWLRTGDIGHYDEDGQFYITDRLKELIKVKGFQVAPAELEELLRCHPDIKDAAVVGVPDERNGEVPKAFIVLKTGAKTTPKDVKKYIESQVANYKQLNGGVVVIDSIPKTTSGKILRKNLRNL